METLVFLLVDDENEFAGVLAERLTRRGFRADCACSGKEAFERLEKEPTVDVVVLDVSMPYPDGIDVLNTIKKKYPLMEVIMLTGRSTVDSAIEAMKLGAFDYLTKPCEVDNLLEVAQKAHARKKKREDALFNVRIKPYISDAEREQLISLIMEGKD